MRSVGIKTLNNRLSEYIRLAASGETVLVTDRDRVVAEIGPPKETRSPFLADAMPAEAVRAGWLTPPVLPATGAPRVTTGGAAEPCSVSWTKTEADGDLRRHLCRPRPTPGGDRRPPVSLWNETLVASRLLEYELSTRLHARKLGESHGDAARGLLGRMPC